MSRCKKKWRLVHPTIRAVWFSFPVDAAQDLCHLSTGKPNNTPLKFGTRVVDTTDLLHGWTTILLSLTW